MLWIFSKRPFHKDTLQSNDFSRDISLKFSFHVSTTKIMLMKPSEDAQIWETIVENISFKVSYALKPLRWKNAGDQDKLLSWRCLKLDRRVNCFDNLRYYFQDALIWLKRIIWKQFMCDPYVSSQTVNYFQNIFLQVGL